MSSPSIGPRPFVSYAQNREDVVLARALCPDDRAGFWIDVGAGDPLLDSVTAAFAERGWVGVNIEPLPREHTRLRELRPRDVNLNVAVGETAGVGKLYEGPDEHRGWSTMVPELADAYRAEGHEFGAIEVRVRTLAQIVDEHVSGQVDFLKVDAEGSERDVLAGADWSWFRPRVVVVEATVPNSNEQNHEQWEPLLVRAGYTCALFDGVNRFYARAEEPALLAALAAPANVVDDFVPYEWKNRYEAAMESAEENRAALATSEARLAEVAAHARRWADDAAVAREMAARLADDLAAAEVRAARALAEAKHAQDELHALHQTRTLRYTASVRGFYGALHRVIHRKR